MPPPHSPDPLAGVDWQRVFAQAVAIALQRTPALHAEDVVQEGVRLLLEGKAPWDSSMKISLPEHLAAIGVNARRNRLRTERRRRNPRVVGKVIMEMDNAPATPEENVTDAEATQQKAQRFERLVAELAGDAEALAVLDLVQQGVDDAAGQAQASGLGIEVIRNARRRIARHAQALSQRDEEEGLSP